MITDSVQWDSGQAPPLGAYANVALAARTARRALRYGGDVRLRLAVDLCECRATGRNVPAWCLQGLLWYVGTMERALERKVRSARVAHAQWHGQAAAMARSVVEMAADPGNALRLVLDVVSQGTLLAEAHLRWRARRNVARAVRLALTGAVDVGMPANPRGGGGRPRRARRAHEPEWVLGRLRTSVELAATSAAGAADASAWVHEAKAVTQRLDLPQLITWAVDSTSPAQSTGRRLLEKLARNEERGAYQHGREMLLRRYPVACGDPPVDVRVLREIR